MLPLTYAQALYKSSWGKEEKDFDGLVGNLKSILTRKGHGALFPAIVREYEKLVGEKVGTDRGVLEVVRESDVTHFKDAIARATAELHINIDTLEIRENQKLIGGFLLRQKSAQIDGSFRRRLLELYRQLVAA